MAEKIDGAEQVLERHALRSALHEIAQRGAVLFAQRAVEREVEIHAPRHPERMGEEVLGVQPRALDALLLQVGGCGVQDFENSHHGRRS